MRSVSHSTGARSSVHGRARHLERSHVAGEQLADRREIGGAAGESPLELRRGERLAQPEDDRVEAQRGPFEHLRKLGRERSSDGTHEPLVLRNGRDVQRDDAARRQVLPHEAEELSRGEVEGDIGLSVRVDDDQVVALVRSTEERTSVDVVHRQARVVLHPEVAAADAAHRRIELDAVDLGVGVVHAERTRRRPCRRSRGSRPARAAARAAAAARGTRPTRRP